jgi:hypothetical protein
MRGFNSRWALTISGRGKVWLFRRFREPEIAGSNPAVLTCCGGARAGTGRRLLSAPTQVRFLPPQLATEHGRLKVARAQGGSPTAGSSNGRIRRFERRDVGPIPTPAIT